MPYYTPPQGCCVSALRAIKRREVMYRRYAPPGWVATLVVVVFPMWGDVLWTVRTSSASVA